MTHQTRHAEAGPRTYLVIAAILLLLTVMEVVVFYIPALARVLVPLLVFLAAAKFALVAMFYMHLRFDDRWYTYVVMFYMHLKFDHPLFRTIFTLPLLIAAAVIIALLFLYGVLRL